MGGRNPGTSTKHIGRKLEKNCGVARTQTNTLIKALDVPNSGLIYITMMSFHHIFAFIRPKSKTYLSLNPFCSSLVSPFILQIIFGFNFDFINLSSQEPGVSLGSPTGHRGPITWVTFYSVPSYICGELYFGWSSWASNQLPYVMPALQVEA